MIRCAVLVSLLVLQLSYTWGFKNQPRTDWFSATTDELKEALKVRPNVGVAKNVILFMGDGMGLSNIMASRVYNAQLNDLSFKEALLSFEKFPYAGLSRTYNVDRMVTDSAAAAGAYLRGQKVNSGTIGVNQDVLKGNCSQMAGNVMKSVLHRSHEAGKWTGVVTTTRLTHASPAQCYGAAANRDWETDASIPEEYRKACKDLAAQLIDEHDYIRVVLGGGRGKFTPTTMPDPEYPDKMGERVDGRDLITHWKNKKAQSLAEDKFKFVQKQSEFDAADETSLEYLLGMFEPGHMNYEVDRTNRSKNVWPEPSLEEMIEKAIRMLRRSSKGYFLFVEGGRIDHAHHAGNAFRALSDTLAFSKAVKRAVDITSAEDTLIIVTADHSHAFTVGGLTPINNPILGLAHKTGLYGEVELDIAQDGLPFTVLSYANGPGYLYHHTNGTMGFPIRGRKDLMDDAATNKLEDIDYLQEAPVPLEDETHGGEDVAIYAKGPMAHLFHGSHEQTMIAHVILYASCVGPSDFYKQHCNNPVYDPWPNSNAGSFTRGSGGVVVVGILLLYALTWFKQ